MPDDCWFIDEEVESDEFDEDFVQEEPEPSDNCPVCLETWSDDTARQLETKAALSTFAGSGIRVLICGHAFHDACADLSIENAIAAGLHATCPVCYKRVATKKTEKKIWDVLLENGRLVW